jgi:hypothetical protein
MECSKSNSIHPSDPILEQYKKCEQLIISQIKRMINMFNYGLQSIKTIEEQIDPEIIKECYYWSKHMDYLYWSKSGYDYYGKDISFHNSINKYIKEHGYTDKYSIDIPDVIFNTNTDTNIRVKCNLFEQEKFLNPFYCNLKDYAPPYYILYLKIYWKKESGHYIVKMYKINTDNCHNKCYAID